jgi:hypothetical protein
VLDDNALAESSATGVSSSELSQAVLELLVLCDVDGATRAGLCGGAEETDGAARTLARVELDNGAGSARRDARFLVRGAARLAGRPAAAASRSPTTRHQAVAAQVARASAELTSRTRRE